MSLLRSFRLANTEGGKTVFGEISKKECFPGVSSVATEPSVYGREKWGIIALLIEQEIVKVVLL